MIVVIYHLSIFIFAYSTQYLKRANCDIQRKLDRKKVEVIKSILREEHYTRCQKVINRQGNQYGKYVMYGNIETNGVSALSIK